MPKSPRRFPFPVPWGLFIVLAGYAALVVAYVAKTHWWAPEYQAAVHYQQAWALLGAGGGRVSSAQDLTLAYEHLLEAARLVPEVRELHDQLEKLNWRFEERRLHLPMELRRRSEAVATLWQRIQEERQPILAVGVRERRWAPDQLVRGPLHTMLWSLLGAGAIVVAWGGLRLSGRSARAAQHEQVLRETEKEIAEVAASRRRGE